MDIEAVALVLCENDDLQEAGVRQVREDKIDQSIMASKGNCGLCPIERQGHESLALAAGEDE